MPNPVEHIPSTENLEKEFNPLLPEEFKLPDLSKLKPNEQNRRNEFVFPLIIRGERIFCRIILSRNNDLDNQPKFTSMKYAMPIEIRIEGHAEDPTGNNPFENLFAFTTYLEVGDFPHKEKYADLKNKPFWNISYRMVEPGSRGKGYGEVALKLTDEVINRIQQETDLRGEYIGVDTALTSVSRLIVDQHWLERHDLSHLKNSGGRDLHFIPHPADTDGAIDLLQNSTEGLKDIMKSGVKDVKFIRPLD